MSLSRLSIFMDPSYTQQVASSMNWRKVEGPAKKARLVIGFADVDSGMLLTERQSG